MTDVKALADGLTEAQRRVLCLLADWGPNPYGHTCGDLHTSVGTPNSLWAAGLATGSRVYGGPLSFNITPLGQLVRAELARRKETPDAE